MLVEAPVLGRERRLDQVIRIVLQRNRIVVPDAARSDLVAEAVEEGDREFGLLQPVLVRGFAERRDRERQRDDESADAERRRFRRGSTSAQRRQPATWKRSMKAEKRS